MNYKIFRVKNFNFQLITNFKADIKFKEAIKLIEDQRFIYCDGFKRESENLGNLCFETFSKIKSIQIQWAKENFLNFNEKNWHDEILIEQIKVFRPDVLYFEDRICFENLKQSELKKIFPFLKLTIVRNGNPSNLKNYDGIDALFVICDQLKRYYEQKNLKSFLVHHYFDCEISNMIKKKPKKYISFIGESGYLLGKEYQERYILLKNLIQEFDINLFLKEKSNRHISKTFYDNIKKYIKVFRNYYFSNFFNLKKKKIFPVTSIQDHILTYRPIKKIFPKNVFDPIYGLEYYQKMQEFCLLINIHRQDVIAGNMRLFEASGLGVPQITNYNDELNTLFEKDHEILFYKNKSELFSKITEVKKNLKIYENIGLNAKKKIYKNHTTKIRLQEIDNLIKKLL